MDNANDASRKENILTVEDVAKYVVSYCAKNKKPLTPKALQKVLYYIQAYSLYKGDDNEIAEATKWNKGTPIFKEPPEAWIHGAVYRKIYQSYRQFGFNDITEFIDIISPDDNNIPIPESHKEFIDYILEICDRDYKFDADKLEEINHKEKAWINARGKAARFEPTYEDIQFEDMEKYPPLLTAKT